MNWDEYWELKELPDETFIAPGYFGADMIEDYADGRVAALENENKRLRGALENIVKHLELVVDGVQLSATWHIATKALQETESK